jgi:hypothetical protein
MTLTPGKGVPSVEYTLPVMVFVCAKPGRAATDRRSVHKRGINNFIFMLGLVYF